MALRFLDSFDHYAAADITLKWTSSAFASRTTGRHGYGMFGSFEKGMLMGSTTLIMESYINKFGAGSYDFFGIKDTSPSPQISCGVLATGALVVNRYVNELIAQTAPDLVRQNTWYHVGWRVVLHPSAGTVELRLNGETVISVTGVQTTQTGAWSGAIGVFTAGGTGNGIVLDDLVVMDDVDDTINDPRLTGGGGFDKFLGPVEVKVKRPNGPGLLAEWTPSPAVANELNVDDLDPDADTTYNSTSAAGVGLSDLLAMENLLPDEDVVAVQSLVLARKTEEGIAAIAKLVRDSGTVTVGTTVYQPSTYSYLHTPEPTRPGGGLWTAAAWDAIRYGYRRMV